MRLIKILGLAAFAALAAMAFVGATTASADVPCLESGHHTSECPANKIWKGDIVGLTAVGTPALLLKNGAVEEECHSQVLALGSTFTNEGSHTGFEILVDTGALTFTNCTGICEEAHSTRPAWLLVEALTLDAWVTEDKAGLPRAKLENCIFGVTCEYQFTNMTQLLKVEGDLIIAASVPLERTAGALCPNNNMSFDAKWLVREDVNGTPGEPLYAAALP